MAAKKKTEKKDNLIPVEQAGAIAPVDEAEMGELLDGTTGGSTGDLDALTIYRQGKENYFKNGEEKVADVTGIFLYSMRPARAFWPIDSEMDGSSPCCWSLEGEAPHGSSDDPQAQSCRDCPWDKLGTAKVGRGKACKTKANDFIIQTGVVEVSQDQKVGPLPVVFVDPRLVVGPALVNYSIGNNVSPKAFRAFVRSAKELGRPPQGVLAKWTWEMARSKSNVEYSACSIEVLGVLPDHTEDPELWQMILKEVRNLKGGVAEQILVALSGSSSED